MEFTSKIKILCRYSSNLYNIKIDYFINHLKNVQIHNLEDYLNYINANKELKFPQYPYKKFPDFSWEKTYETSKYYNQEECINKLKSLMEEYEINGDETLELLAEDHEDLLEELHKIDNKIPNQTLWIYYGCEKSRNSYIYIVVIL